jgi:hypothetical protein
MSVDVKAESYWMWQFMGEQLMEEKDNRRES